MRHRLLSLVALLLAAGCGESGPVDLTQRTLEQVRSGQYDEAIETGSEAIAGEPTNAANYLYRGRAYHFRNAMGDRKRAIADFGEAIRLAPDSSDAYYSRALAYRDVGETELADADEQKARQLDGTLQDAYKRMPDLTPPAEVAKAPTEQQEQEAAEQAVADGQPPENERELYEKLKQRYEPGFGKLRSPGKTEDQKAAERLQEARKERYRQLMQQPTVKLPSQTETPEGSDLLGGVDLNSPDRGEVAEGNAATEGAGAGGNLGLPGGLPGVRPLTPQGDQRQQPQGQTPPLAPTPGLRSPFPQRAPAPTGFGEAPTNPFAPPLRTPTGGAPTVAQPFGARSQPLGTQVPAVNPYSNPAVRPPNPRDYLP